MALAVPLGGSADWDLTLLVTLLAFSVIGDFMAVETRANVKLSGSFLALVLAMVFLGGPPAALIGVVTIVVGWLRWRDSADDFLINLLAYSWFPLIGGLAFGVARDEAGLEPSDGFFYLLVFGVFLLALAVNYSIIAGYSCYLERSSFSAKARKALTPVLPSELFAALLAVGIAYLYHRVGLAAIALFGIVLFTFQHLLGQLLISEERAEELERRNEQLADLQLGVLSALVHTLDLRDRMTARHSAAVARHAKRTARAAGLSEQEQDLVHTAALLHDIGKFIFPDRILKGNGALTGEDWKTIRMHPEQGAKLVSQIEGYGPVGDIILAHHERIDGKGYPRGLKGDEIPMLSRIISVADVYDVMTARDSYREPVSSFEAIRELRRVAGTQLDAHFVEIFTQMLAGKDVRYRHGEDADFDAELGLERRAREYAAPVTAGLPSAQEQAGTDGALDGQAEAKAADGGRADRPSLGRRRRQTRG